MHKGGKFLVAAAVLACTACLGEAGKLEVRSVQSGLKSGAQPVPYRIAEARAQLALGNVALALEGFRKAHREDPASIEALAGMADCYERMGRFDLSRRNYETALALAPRDPGLLTAFAGSLDRQGLADQAASVRREAASAMSALASAATHRDSEEAAAAAALALPGPAVEAGEAHASLPQLAEIKAAPLAPVGSSVTIALQPPKPAAPVIPKAAPPQSPAIIPVGRSVTIALKPPPPAAPVEAPRRQPRLERLSLTEVALITGSGPRWARPQIRPVRSAAIGPGLRAHGGLRVLNAARVNKLAARTSAYLGRFGWREIAVGDAAAVRARSLILYPLDARTEARRLSARLGFATAARRDVRQLTILLGRDAASHPELRTRG